MMTRIPLTLVIEDGIEENMILSSLSTMVGVDCIELHRKKKRWRKGYLEDNNTKDRGKR